MTKVAICRCGAVRVECEGEPVRISVCHCLNCQRRSGSAFSAQVRFPEEHARITGETREWVHTGDSGNKGYFSFCPTCGSGTHYRIDAMPGVVAVPLGNFAEKDCFTPQFSVFENRKHSWVEIVGEGIEHD